MTDARTPRQPLAAAGSTRAFTLRPVAAVLIASALLVGCTARSETPVTMPSVASSTWSVASPQAAGNGSGNGAGASASGSAPDVGRGASQSAAEAARDGVALAVAALPARERIRQVPAGRGGPQTRAWTSEGIWLVSRPSVAARAAGGYGELLLLDPSGAQIRAAYPFAGLAPQWLLITPVAIYCGRSGDTAAPDAMVCRVDRTTRQVRVRVFADRLTEAATTAADVAARPGRWTVDDQHLTADFGRPPQLRPTELLFPTAAGTQPLRLDPETLQVIGS